MASAAMLKKIEKSPYLSNGLSTILNHDKLLASALILWLHLASCWADMQ